MSIEKVRDYLTRFGRDGDIIEFPVSSATVELAAQAANVIPARIAKSMSLMTKNGVIIIVTAGDTRINNRKYKDYFGCKAKFLTPDEAFERTGHAVGGVCPFALPDGVMVYLDVSIKRFKTVFPACGSSNSAIELTCDDLYKLSDAQDWIDVCSGWEEEK